MALIAHDPALNTETVSTDVRSISGCQTTSGSDTDEKLFFELSQSSGSDGDVEKPQSSGEAAIGVTSTEDVANGGHVDSQHRGLPDLQRERHIEDDHGDPQDGVQPPTEEPATDIAPAPQRNSRRDLCVATDSSRDPRGSSPPGKGAALQLFNGAAYHAHDEPSPTETTEENAETQPESLDLVAAMLPLIPSFPEGSAEVRVRVHGIRIPRAGLALATPPYVRATLHPGAQSIARTGPPSVGHTSFNKISPGSSKEGGLQLAEQPPAEQVMEYRFGGECGGGTNGNQHTISLPLGPSVVDAALGENAGSSPPRIRLEIVSGRSLGWCDLALPEALRRPGSVVRKLRAPVWRNGWVHRQVNKYGGHVIPPSDENSTPRHPSSHERNTFGGEITLDLGVALSGEPWPSPSETKKDELTITTGTIRVEAAKVRIRDTEKGGVALNALQRTTLIGVNSSLALRGGEPILSTFHAEGHESRWKGESKTGCPAAQGDVSCHDREVVLMTTCAELDILTLRLLQREDGWKPRQRGGRGALMIAVSDINDVFDGRWQWVPIRHDTFGEDFDSQKSIHPSGGQAGVLGRGGGGAGCQLEALLRISVADIAPLRPYRPQIILSTGGRPPDNRLLPRHKSEQLSGSLPDEDTGVAEPPPCDGAATSALEAWTRSPGNGCAQAIAVVPSQGTNSSEWAAAQPKRGTTSAGKVENTAGYPSQTGPGVLGLEVLAIHGQRLRVRPPTIREEDSNLRGSMGASTTTPPPSWWVRVTFSNGGGGEAGGRRKDVSSIDSPPGKVLLLERSQAQGGREGILHQLDAEGIECDWMVRWPPPGGVLATHPVHWTPSQNSLPIVSFEVFQRQTLTARSMLELPPIIEHQDSHLAFLHPCLQIGPPTTGALKNSDTNVFLDLRCSFNTNVGKHKRQHLQVGDVLAEGRRGARPPSETRALLGGVLCVQVVAIQRLHRSVRSALAWPCSVVFSLPHQNTEVSSISWNNPSCGGGDGWDGAYERTYPNDFNQTKDWQKQWGEGERDIAVLRVEPRKFRRSVVALVALFGQNGGEPQGVALDSLGERDTDTSKANQSLLGATWLPISDNVMERGHLEDRWYPLRVVGKAWDNASKACDIRLRFHFIPALQHPAAGLSFEEPSVRPSPEFEDPNTEFLMIILEEGRHLGHPDLLVGPFELFAEISVDYQPGDALGKEAGCDTRVRRPACTAARSKRVLGPLPLREGPRPQGGRAPHHATARSLGNGAAPCWQHVMRIPLPAAKSMAGSAREESDVFNNRARNLHPGVTGRGQDENYPPKAMLSVAIKSAAMRVSTGYPSPVPRRLLTRGSDGHAQQPEERISERCLLLGVARIRLPSFVLRHELGEGDGTAIRAWYTVKDETTGAHRGKVRLSIFRASTSSDCAQLGGSSQAEDNNANIGDGSKGRRFSSSSKRPHLAESNLRRARGSGIADGYSSDSSRQSTETDDAVVALRRAGGCDLPQSLQGAGLLFVSIGDLVVRSYGNEMRLPIASLVGANVSLRNRRGYRHGHQDGRLHPLTKTQVEGPKPFRGRNSGCTHSPSPLEIEKCEFGAVVALDRYDGPDDYPALYVQAHVKTPHRTTGTTFHGVVPLTSCLSSAGTSVQERKGLIQMERQREEVGHTNPKTRMSDRAFSARNCDFDVDTASTEAPSTSSGNGHQSSDAERPAWASGKAEKTGGCCSVNVTTSFLPHARGLLEVDPIQLSLAPPSHSDLERWRDLSDLRRRTEPKGAEDNTQMGLTEGLAANEFGRDARATPVTTTAFLRFRILPAGPWKFSRMFPLKLPRPVDWRRNPSDAGTSLFPGEARAVLELDTAVHAIARKHASAPSPAACGRCSRQDCGFQVGVEPLTLEVCLFDNGRRFSSPLALPSSSSLLAIGSVVLAPIIVANGVRLGKNRSNSRREEVLLFEPISGRPFASTLLGMIFSSSDTSYAPPTESPRTSDAANICMERMPTIFDASEAIWALKAIFYAIDHGNVGFVPVEDILSALSGEEWPQGTSASLQFTKPTRNAVITSEAHANGDAETLLNRLGRLGVGVRHRGGRCDHADYQDDSSRLMHYIRHLLVPPGSKGDDEFVSWEVWAALSELIVCRSRPALAPRVTAASIWQRAEEIRRAETTIPADTTVDDASRTGFLDARSEGDLGIRSAAGFGGFDCGHGDISFWADEDCSREQRPPKEYFKAVEKPGRSRTSRNPPHHHVAPSATLVRRRPNTAPHSSVASIGRLHQTLAKSQRSWSLRSKSQRQLRRDQGQGRGEVQTRDYYRALRRSSSSPSHRDEATYSATTLPCQRDETYQSRRFSEREGAEDPITTQPVRRRPMTAPVYPTTSARPLPAQQESHQTVHESSRMRGEDDGLQPEFAHTTGFISQSVGWCGAGAVVNGGGNEFEWRGEEAADHDMGKGHLRTETASAKRKAAQYQTCMLEAQRAFGKEHQRVLALEERAFEAEGLLLQREKIRIREEAWARTRFMQVQVETARRTERVASKKNRARVEAAAATRLQWIAKGYLERYRFKADVRSIKALQRSARSLLRSRRGHHSRVRRNLAALLLQSIWRGRSARKGLAALEVRVNLVQAVVRGHLQRTRISDELQGYLRCRNEAATVLQKNRRRVVSRGSFLSLRGASIKVQSSYQIWRARRRLEQRRFCVRVLQRAAKLFVFHRYRVKAVTLLQKSYRLHIRMKRCRHHRRAIFEAVGVIQQVVRAWVARRMVRTRREKRRMDRAATTIQRTMWVHLCRRKEHRRRVAAALTLCKFMGGLSVNLSQMRKRRKSSAATSIQSAFRVRRSRLRLSALRARRRGILAASKIQAVARGHRSRVEARALLAKRRKESAACTIIQAASRGHVSRIKTRAILLEQREGSAATRIQALFRGHRSRAETGELCAKRRAAAKMIHSLLLRHHRRERVRACRRDRERSALVERRAWRKSKTSGDAKLAQTNSTATLTTDTAQRGFLNVRSAWDCSLLDRTNLQLLLGALTKGVASCSIRSPSNARQIHQELALCKDDPVLETLLCQRLSGLETALTSSRSIANKAAEVQGRNGDLALLRSLSVLEAGLLRLSA